MIPYQRLSTYPRFETEAQGNSEMAYSGHDTGTKDISATFSVLFSMQGFFPCL